MSLFSLCNQAAVVPFGSTMNAQPSHAQTTTVDDYSDVYVNIDGQRTTSTADLIKSVEKEIYVAHLPSYKEASYQKTELETLPHYKQLYTP